MHEHVAHVGFLDFIKPDTQKAIVLVVIKELQIAHVAISVLYLAGLEVPFVSDGLALDLLILDVLDELGDVHFGYLMATHVVHAFRPRQHLILVLQHLVRVVETHFLLRLLRGF